MGGGGGEGGAIGQVDEKISKPAGILNSALAGYVLFVVCLKGVTEERDI